MTSHNSFCSRNETLLFQMPRELVLCLLQPLLLFPLGAVADPQPWSMEPRLKCKIHRDTPLWLYHMLWKHMKHHLMEELKLHMASWWKSAWQVTSADWSAVYLPGPLLASEDKSSSNSGVAHSCGSRWC